MSKSYSARFTPCGYSIKQLRSDADRLKKTEGIPHQEALDRIARSIKYSDWDELVGQKSNLKRDAYFHGMYKDRNGSDMDRSNYSDFLRREKLAGNKDSYRQFVLQTWTYMEALGLADMDLDVEPMHPDLLLEEMGILIVRHGVTALLPQNMGVRILETTVLAGHVFRDELDVSDEIRQGFFEVALLSIASIRSYQLKSAEVAFHETEVVNFIHEYYLLAQLEFTSRRTGMTVALPDLDHIFTPEAQISIRLPESFAEMVRSD